MNIMYMPCFCKCEECINVGSSQISLLFRIFQFVSLFSTCTCVTILLEKLTYTAVLSKKIYFKKRNKSVCKALNFICYAWIFMMYCSSKNL